MEEQSSNSRLRFSSPPLFGIPYGRIARGAAGAEFADVPFPAAMIAGKVNHMLQIDPIPDKQDPIQPENGIQAEAEPQPEQQLSQGDIVDDDGIQGHGIFYSLLF